MKRDDLPKLHAMLTRVAAGLDVPAPGTDRSEFYLEALGDLSIEQVAEALRLHVRASAFFPKPAEILAQVPAAKDDGRPGADEAWAIAMGFADQAITVTWTDEMAAAWGVCRHLHASGDKVGARMAFREAYSRHVDEARRQGIAVRWTASLGWQAGERRESLLQARAHGRLTDFSTTQQIAGSSRAASATPLIELAYSAGVPEPARAALQALHVRFAQRASQPSADAIAKVEAAQAKQELAERVQAYMDTRVIGERVAAHLGANELAQNVFVE